MIKINSGPEFKKSMEENGEAIAEMVGDVAGHIAGIESKIEEQVDSAIVRARKAGRTVQAFAKENPWQFAGLALGVGLLAGWLLKKKD